MEHKINPAVAEIQISGIRKFFNMIAGREDIISLTLGQPDFNTPEHIRKAAIAAIENNITRYTHNAGFIELRDLAADWMEKKYNINYSPQDEIIVTAGSSQAIDVALRAILTVGDEVILPAPVYPGYEPIIKLCGAESILVDTRDTKFKLTPEQLDKHISKKTKAVILPYPANPTGAILSRTELASLADYLDKKEIFVIADELYSELVFEDRFHSITTFGNMRERTIVVNGLSKSHAMTGWRIGLLLAPRQLAQHIIKVHQYNVACASSISQKAAIEALANGFSDAAPMREAYRERVNYAWKKLNDIGLPTHKPGGAFYIFPSIRHLGIPSFDFALRLVEEAGVACIPGDAFSKYGEGYIRISCACPMDNIIQGLAKIEEFLRKNF